MEITWDAITSILLIIGIDLVLAGDNAIVIGMAAKNLPQNQQKKAILLGSIGAVVIRACAAFIVVTLIQIPWLHLISGLLLMVIAYKFLVEQEPHNQVKSGKNLWSAVRTIVVADALMGIDNVLAIAGAANGHFSLIIIGLLISIPLIMWGSTLFIHLMNRFPWLIYVGSGLLAFTAGKMIVAEPAVKSPISGTFYMWLIEIGVIVLVLGLGWAKQWALKKQVNPSHHLNS